MIEIVKNRKKNTEVTLFFSMQNILYLIHHLLKSGGKLLVI